MLTYNERIELREKLINGEISLELAKEQYWKDYKEGQRSWIMPKNLLKIVLKKAF